MIHRPKIKYILVLNIALGMAKSWNVLVNNSVSFGLINVEPELSYSRRYTWFNTCHVVLTYVETCISYQMGQLGLALNRQRCVRIFLVSFV